MLLRGPSCFDFDFYRSKNADLAVLTDKDKLWQHFVKDGQFEGRTFRCSLIEKPTLNLVELFISACPHCLHAYPGWPHHDF